MVVSADGRWLLVATHDDKLRLYDVVKRKLVHELYDHLSGVFALAISPDGKWCASVTRDSRVWVFDREKGTEKKRTPVLLATPSSVAFTSDGKTLLIGGSGPHHGLAVWDWQTSREQRGGYPPPGSDLLSPRNWKDQNRITAMALSADGKQLFVASAVIPVKDFAKSPRYAVHVWDTRKLPPPKEGAKDKKP